MPKLNARRGVDLNAPARRETAKELLSHAPFVFPRAGNTDVTILSVDPGTTHVGVAIGCRWDQAPGWKVYCIAEMLPDDFAAWVFPRLNQFDVIGCEDFMVYANKAKELIGSRLETVRLLGWMEFTIKEWNRRPLDQRTAGPYDIQWFSHMAAIHKGTEAVLKHQGIPFVSPKTPDHARSAELHLWHFLIRNGLVDGVKLA